MTRKRKKNRGPRKKSGEELQKQRESGEPGGGAGRRDEVGGSGVYPASSEHVPDDAEVRTAGEWGQKLGGQVGGSSELNPLELGIEYDEAGQPRTENTESTDATDATD